MQSRYRSDLNRDVAPAASGEFQPLSIGPMKVWPPVVLAPMAGVTNWPFRQVCRRFGYEGTTGMSAATADTHAGASYGGPQNTGLYVSEMITARPLVEGHAKTLRLADFGPEETPRSLQLYGVDPYYMGEAVKRLVGEGRVDHIDLNFGCPVPKVTRQGGGAVIPAKPRLLRELTCAAVRNAGNVPVTMKFRMGIDEDVITHLDAGRVAEDEGCAAIALHARTAEQLYDGHARWDAIAQLKKAVSSMPVLGNGDIWEAFDALRMMRQTGCDGVVVGRGCLGRPWLFRELGDVLSGREPRDPPAFGEVVEIALEHARLLTRWLGEHHAMRAFRRHTSWYTKGFRHSTAMRADLMRVESLQELQRVLQRGDPEEPFPPQALRVRRCKASGTQKVKLPEGFFANRQRDARPPPAAAEARISGG